jgi:hypothetical protein
MRAKLLLGLSVAVMSVTGALHSTPARADGPETAYENGGTDQSLDPGEERMTADEENQARHQDLSDAYDNGYKARAKEDAETYASLRDQLKHPPQQAVPPLPDGMPPGADDASARGVQQAQVPPPPMPAQQPYQQAYQPQPQYVPPPPSYQAAPVDYAPAQAYAAPQPYAQPVYEEAYAPPPPPQPVQYVPVYAGSAYVPQPPVQTVVQPVVTIAAPAPYPVYRAAYYRRPYVVRYGYPAY